MPTFVRRICTALLLTAALSPPAHAVEGPADQDPRLARLQELVDESVRLRAEGQFDQALATREQGLALVREIHGVDSEEAASWLGWLGKVAGDKGDWGRASQYFRDQHHICQKLWGESDYRTIDADWGAKTAELRAKLAVDDQKKLAQAEEMNGQGPALDSQRQRGHSGS